MSGSMGAVLRERAVIVAAILAPGALGLLGDLRRPEPLVRRALVFGAIYIVVVEGIFGTIDFVIREATVIYYVRVLAVRWLDLSGAELVDRPVDGGLGVRPA